MCGIPLTKGATYLYYAPKPVEFSSSSAAFVLTTIKEAFFFKLKIFYFERFSKKPRLLGPKQFYHSNVTTHKIYYRVSDYFSYQIAWSNPLSQQCSILPLILALMLGMYRIHTVAHKGHLFSLQTRSFSVEIGLLHGNTYMFHGNR